MTGCESRAAGRFPLRFRWPMKGAYFRKYDDASNPEARRSAISRCVERRKRLRNFGLIADMQA
jgi:hypothetical protein